MTSKQDNLVAGAEETGVVVPLQAVGPDNMDMKAEKRPSNEAFREEKLLGMVNRAIGVVARETKALRDEVIVDLRPYSDAKSRVLLDLNRIMEEIVVEPVPASLVSEIRILKQVLEDNEQLLSSHLEAVREITGLVAATMVRTESDGTYSNNFKEMG